MPLPNSDTYQLKQGGGCASLFGLPFALAGLGVIIAGFIPADVRGGDEFSPMFAIPFGGVFLLVGSAILFGRSGLEIDRSAGTVTKWWGLLVPMKRKENHISDFSRILATREVRRSKNSSYTVYPISLADSSGTLFKVTEERELIKARSCCEELAKFLDFPIHDQTSGTTNVRDVDSLDESLKEQFEKGRWTNELPEPPANPKAKIDYDGTNLRIETPKGKVGPMLIFPLLFLLVFELIAFLNVVRPMLNNEFGGSSSLLTAVFGMAFIVTPLIVISVLVRRTIFNSQKITVNQQGLKVESKGRATQRIPKNEIEELFIGGQTKGGALNLKGKYIIARSDSQSVPFGTNLPDEELQYVFALSRAILIS